MNTKSPGTQVAASREEREAINCLKRATLEQNSKHLSSQTSSRQREPVHQSMAAFYQLDN